MEFKIHISVNKQFKGVLQWSANELQYVNGLLARLQAELELISEGLDWEVIEHPESLFWGLSPQDFLSFTSLQLIISQSHPGGFKKLGSFGSGALGKIGDKNKIRGWLDESLVILIAKERGLPRHHVQFLQWASFGLLVKDPIAFARVADPEQLLKEHSEWNEWAEGVREREEF